MKILVYLLLSSACLSLCYMVYRLVYARKANFRELRMYLLGSLLISLLVPFSNYRIDIRNTAKAYTVVQNSDSLQPVPIQPDTGTSRASIDWKSLALSIYLTITAVFLGRIVLQLIMLIYSIIRSNKIRDDRFVILFNHGFKTTFSFFNWIFVVPGEYSGEDLDQIIAHEKVHAMQYHSLDLIIMELMVAVTWYNPLVWMTRNSMQLVHEYLADEGALSTGIDRVRYQALLVNQIAGGRLVCLSSSFNDSLTKKRLLMMTTGNIYRKTTRLLTLIPLSASLLLVMAVMNGLLPERMKAGTAVMSTEKTDLSGIDRMFADAADDTIKKEMIVKIINTDGQTDTVITKTFTIKVDGDSTHKDVMIWHAVKEGDDTSRVIHVFDDKEMKNLIMVNEDSIVKVDVVTKGGKEVKIITVEKTVEKHTGDVPADDKTLIIIDGVKQNDKHALALVDPDDIESMSVIRDKKMMKTYTDKDYDGVIIIVTKKGKK